MEDKDIELRSEQVRKIIGQIPPLLVRSGIGVIGIIMKLAAGCSRICPLSRNSGMRHHHDGHSARTVSAYRRAAVCLHHTSNYRHESRIELEGYTSKEYGYLQGTVTTVSTRIIMHNGHNYFSFTLSLKEVSFMRKA